MLINIIARGNQNKNFGIRALQYLVICGHSTIRAALCETRSKTEIWLIGFTSSEILGSELPMTRQVLSYLFHIIKQTNPKPSESDASLTVAKSVFFFWAKIHIFEFMSISKFLKLSFLY